MMCMTEATTVTCACTPGCPIPYGLCHCGCGGQTTISGQSDTASGYAAGQPKRFIRGHSGRKITHGLSELNETTRTATCSICGPVSVSSRGKTSTGRQQWRCLGRVITQHTLVNIDPLTETADCRGCQGRVNVVRKAGRGKGWGCANKQQGSAAEYRNANAREIQGRHREWREANPAYRRQVRDAALKRTYGVTGEECDAEVARRFGRCDICGEVPAGNGPNGMSLCVEHDHATGKVRGYTDRGCNVMIGGAGDDPVRLAQGIAYLHPTMEQLAQIIRIIEVVRERTFTRAG
jgi:hypothetical protein